MASSNHAFLVRRFGTLGVRVVLMMQDKLTELESQLEEEDLRVQQNPDANKASSGTFRQDPSPRRIELLQKIRHELGEYRE